jgi:hypothetical protein
MLLLLDSQTGRIDIDEAVVYPLVAAARDRPQPAIHQAMNDKQVLEAGPDLDWTPLGVLRTSGYQNAAGPV